MDFESADGQVKNPEAEFPPVSVVRNRALNNGKILIVEDEAITRNGLCKLLSDWGYDVKAVEDGTAALQKVNTFKPSLVISDLAMPEMDGLELLRQLKTKLSHVSVIILSGQRTTDIVVQAMREGAYDYLTKPVNIKQLQLLIEKALKHQIIRQDHPQFWESSTRLSQTD